MHFNNERVIKHNDIHYAIVGKLFKVNFYPTTGTFYINGGNKTIKEKGNNKYPSIDWMIRLADGEIEVDSLSQQKSKRKSLTSKKHKLFDGYTSITGTQVCGIKNCFWCNKELQKTTATVEHKIPLSKGGTNRMDNLTLACTECNKARKDNLSSLKLTNN